jgi:hypothetical protein
METVLLVQAGADARRAARAVAIAYGQAAQQGRCPALSQPEERHDFSPLSSAFVSDIPGGMPIAESLDPDGKSLPQNGSI